MTSPVQLNLNVSLRDGATFGNFYIAEDRNIPLVKALQAVARGEEKSPHLIWGSPGSGLTHLMQAVCHEASGDGRSVQYLPLQDIRRFDAEQICEGLESSQILCLDGVDLVVEDPAWELVLFHLFNKTRDAGHMLLLGSHVSPQALSIRLADLKSRVRGCLAYQIYALDDSQKQVALIARAKARGLIMSADVARYILSRAPRDMHNLFNLLDRLDQLSLQHQRKLTIPFVKESLGI